MTLRALLNRSSNLMLVVGATTAGVLLPRIDAVQTLTVPIVAFLIYISLKDIKFRNIQSTFEAKPVISVFLVSYVTLPVAAFLLAPALADPQSRIGLYIVAASPMTAGSSIVWTKLSGGDVELASVLAIVSILASPIITPFILSFLAGSTVQLSPNTVIKDLLLIIGCGVTLQFVVPNNALSELQLNYGARASIAILVYSSVSQLGIKSLGTNISAVLGTTGTLLLVGFLASLSLYRVINLVPRTFAAVFFSGSLKNLGVALLIVSVLDVPQATLVIVSYYIFQQLVSAVTADFLFPQILSFTTETNSPAD